MRVHVGGRDPPAPSPPIAAYRARKVSHPYRRRNRDRRLRRAPWPGSRSCRGCISGKITWRPTVAPGSRVRSAVVATRCAQAVSSPIEPQFDHQARPVSRQGRFADPPERNETRRAARAARRVHRIAQRRRRRLRSLRNRYRAPRTTLAWPADLPPRVRKPRQPVARSETKTSGPFVGGEARKTRGDR